MSMRKESAADGRLCLPWTFARWQAAGTMGGTASHQLAPRSLSVNKTRPSHLNLVADGLHLGVRRNLCKVLDAVVGDTDALGLAFAVKTLEGGPHVFAALGTLVGTVDEEEVDVAIEVDAVNAGNHVLADDRRGKKKKKKS